MSDTESPLVALLMAAQRLANDQKQPAAIVDWASAMYDAMADTLAGSGSAVKMADLLALEDYALTGSTYLISRRTIS